jgi:hypothetical protein
LDLSQRGIDLALEFEGVELFVLSYQTRSRNCIQRPAFQQPLVWGFGLVVPLDDPSAFTPLFQQLHRWAKVIVKTLPRPAIEPVDPLH